MYRANSAKAEFIAIRYTSPSRRKIIALRRCKAGAPIRPRSSSTAFKSNAERLMTFSTSAVAVCCCSASEVAGLGLHLLEQPRVLDGDHRLVGEGLHEFDCAGRPPPPWRERWRRRVPRRASSARRALRATAPYASAPPNSGSSRMSRCSRLAGQRTRAADDPRPGGADGPTCIAKSPRPGPRPPPGSESRPPRSADRPARAADQ